FSSRRRHTRSKRDWSSDVCSSDLSTASAKLGAVLSILANYLHTDPYRGDAADIVASLDDVEVGAPEPEYSNFGFAVLGQALVERSEERRVGKEGRRRGAAAVKSRK